ncbi:hypothetical protein CSM81_24255, partial [Salmonella enterica subsp. enterica serovar Infantis]|nr:hypothetical protein [Salmonella enterica subsp. enterica serovar Infantis]
MGNASRGTGLEVSGAVNLANTTATGTTEDGKGVDVAGSVMNSGSSLTGTATGAGTGVELRGDVTGGRVSGDAAGAGTGVMVSGGRTETDVAITGTTEDGKGVDIAGRLRSAGSTTVKGLANGKGTGVNQGGSVSGGRIDGHATSGA